MLQQQRTKLPLLLLLAYPGALQQVGLGAAVLPGIPIRRPHDELTTRTTRPSQVAADEPTASGQNAAAADDANSLIREQFIQGVLQGLQSMSSNGAAAIQPAVLADFLQQANAFTTTRAPRITSPTNKKAALLADPDPDYDYIDFKSGARIQYDLLGDQPQSPNVTQYPNKKLQPLVN
ncbi:uncharacterized protein LOC108594790 [Drosophila busckii]|uniref:uncharacterized protein LOC108594790 n=1 Tax=Drosophila busckii TaxID=30019 RepID=UPI00083F30AB|nr:uncharacterized protein LOC108594790 [Drosophila busckii]